MDKIEKIRQFVKELQQDFISIQPKDCSLDLIKSYAGYAYLDKVLSFLDTLSEELDKSLEEAAEEAATGLNLGSHLMFIKGFKAGAEWKKDALLEWAKETYLTENASAIRKVCFKQLVEKLMSM